MRQGVDPVAFPQDQPRDMERGKDHLPEQPRYVAYNGEKAQPRLTGLSQGNKPGLQPGDKGDRGQSHGKVKEVEFPAQDDPQGKEDEPDRSGKFTPAGNGLRRGSRSLQTFIPPFCISLFDMLWDIPVDRVGTGKNRGTATGLWR